jgi:hypothetical protein
MYYVCALGHMEELMRYQQLNIHNLCSIDHLYDVYDLHMVQASGLIVHYHHLLMIYLYPTINYKNEIEPCRRNLC